ncbi:MAG: hypothetical protein IKI45_07145 [Oscillospiraceae bacterium]|nr:hypothetical protein [Oscillospiraceae bacterium]
MNCKAIHRLPQLLKLLALAAPYPAKGLPALWNPIFIKQLKLHPKWDSEAAFVPLAGGSSMLAQQTRHSDARMILNAAKFHLIFNFQLSDMHIPLL